MDVSHLLRAARRRAGFSQRDLAAASGVALSTIALAEAGRTAPRTATLQRLLRACGTSARAPMPVRRLDEDERRWLERSTTDRLRISVGEPVAAALVAAARGRRLALAPAAAAAVWRPHHPVPFPVPVVVGGGAELDDPAGLLRLDLSSLPVGEVAVHLTPGIAVLVAPPEELVREPACAQVADALAAVAAHLHVCAPRDEAGRRRPPHRDPAEDDERERLARSLDHALPWSQQPTPADSRGWRVPSVVSLEQWLTARGQPPRKGARRRSV